MFADKLTKNRKREIGALISGRGQQFISAPLPKGVERHALGKCFGATILEALKARAKGKKLMYCEGLASVRGSEFMLHAWLTDGKHAFDVIWGIGTKKEGVFTHIPPSDVVYIGIPMEPKEVKEWYTTVQYDGILANRFRDPELADKALYSVIKK